MLVLCAVVSPAYASSKDGGEGGGSRGKNEIAGLSLDKGHGERRNGDGDSGEEHESRGVGGIADTVAPVTDAVEASTDDGPLEETVASTRRAAGDGAERRVVEPVVAADTTEHVQPAADHVRRHVEGRTKRALALVDGRPRREAEDEGSRPKRSEARTSTPGEPRAFRHRGSRGLGAAAEPPSEPSASSPATSATPMAHPTAPALGAVERVDRGPTSSFARDPRPGAGTRRASVDGSPSVARTAAEQPVHGAATLDPTPSSAASPTTPSPLSGAASSSAAAMSAGGSAALGFAVLTVLAGVGLFALGRRLHPPELLMPPRPFLSALERPG